MKKGFVPAEESFVHKKNNLKEEQQKTDLTVNFISTFLTTKLGKLVAATITEINKEIFRLSTQCRGS